MFLVRVFRIIACCLIEVKYLREDMIKIIWLVTIVLTTFSFFKDREKTLRALKLSYRSIMNLVPGILGMIGLVGFMLSIIPKEVLTTIFTYKGFLGFVSVSFIGAIATIPAPIAFPLAGSLLKAGASPATLASFITTLTMVGLVSAPLEIAHFGKRFTITRQLLSFISALLIGMIMGLFL